MSSPVFTYDSLNKSERPECKAIRRTLESWFADFPEEEKAEFRRRFNSGVDHNFYSAFFELYLHELLRGLGCKVKVEPPVNGVKTHPDFLVEAPSGDTFYLEATDVIDPEELTGNMALQKVLDILKKIEHPNFFVEPIGRIPPLPLPENDIRRFVEEQLASLDYEQAARDYKEKGKAGRPIRVYRWKDYSLTFCFIPKLGQCRGKITGVIPLLQIGDPVCVPLRGEDGPITQKIKDKRPSRYGDLRQPYIIAIDIITGRISTDVERAFDRAFSKKQKNERISGILIGTGISPWCYDNLCLYHNPYAKPRYTSVLTKLPQYKRENGKWKFKDGERPSNFLH